MRGLIAESHFNMFDSLETNYDCNLLRGTNMPYGCPLCACTQFHHGKWLLELQSWRWKTMRVMLLWKWRKWKSFSLYSSALWVFQFHSTYIKALRSVLIDMLEMGCTTARKRSSDMSTNVYTLARHVTTIMYWTVLHIRSPNGLKKEKNKKKQETFSMSSLMRL